MGQRTYTCEECGVIGVCKTTGPTRRFCPPCAAERNRRFTVESQERAKASGYRFSKPMFCIDCGDPIPPAPPRKRRKTRCVDCYERAQADRATRHQRLTTYEARAKWLRTYGITPEDYDRMYADQGGRCDICWQPDESLHVDHDHVTGRVRALLCGKCNRMIGLANEDPAILGRAVSYLQRHKDDPRHSPGAAH